MNERFRRHWWVPAVLFGLLFVAALAYTVNTESVVAVDFRLPADLPFKRIGGPAVTRADLAGRPWVLNVWLPG